MPKKLLICLLLFLIVLKGIAQKQSIDSLIKQSETRIFNGCILIVQNGKVIYNKRQGFTDFESKLPFNDKSQFVIGSVSKQITAVLVLRLLDKGLIDLHLPIRKYLPNFSRTWADSVTIHQLLNHTSGVTAERAPLAFPAGTKFLYGNSSYKILGDIVANVSKKSFTTALEDLFRNCKMKNTSFPKGALAKNVVKGYDLQANGTATAEQNTFENYLPAALVISTPKDLVRWNEQLHEGKLLSKKTYQLMTTGYAKRNHPIFGEIPYGYGLQMDTAEGINEVGHGGYAPGFPTINFYYPKTKTSVIVMENVDFKDENFKKTFFFHTEIRKIIRKNQQ